MVIVGVAKNRKGFRAECLTCGNKTEGQTKRLYEHLKRCPGERTVEAGHIDQETENVEDGEVHSIE